MFAGDVNAGRRDIRALDEGAKDAEDGRDDRRIGRRRVVVRGVHDREVALARLVGNEGNAVMGAPVFVRRVDLDGGEEAQLVPMRRETRRHQRVAE